MRTLADDAKVVQGLLRLRNCLTKCLDGLNKGRFPVTFEMQSDFDWVHHVYVTKPSSDITRSDMVRMNEIWAKYNLRGFGKI